MSAREEKRTVWMEDSARVQSVITSCHKAMNLSRERQLGRTRGVCPSSDFLELTYERFVFYGEPSNFAAIGDDRKSNCSRFSGAHLSGVVILNVCD